MRALIRPIYQDPITVLEPADPEFDYPGEDYVRWDVGFDCAITIANDADEDGFNITVSVTHGRGDRRAITPAQVRAYADALIALAERAGQRRAESVAEEVAP